jgi:hypothetical protein
VHSPHDRTHQGNSYRTHTSNQSWNRTRAAGREQHTPPPVAAAAPPSPNRAADPTATHRELSTTERIHRNLFSHYRKSRP